MARGLPRLQLTILRGSNGSIRSSGKQTRRKRDAAPQTWHVAERQGRAWRPGEEPQAGDRDRPLGGAERGSEGSAQTLQPLIVLTA